MICTYPRPIAPQHASFEMAPPPTPVRYEDSAQAQFMARPAPRSALPRGPMTAQLRGPFATHAALENHAQPSRMTRLNEAFLSLDKNAMRDDVDHLVASFRSEPSSPPPPSRLSVLNESFKHLGPSAMLNKVDQFVTSLESESSSPPPPSNLNVLNMSLKREAELGMEDRIRRVSADIVSAFN